MAFQSNYGTFATCGSDGIVTFWDKDNKQRLKAFPALPQGVPCSAFNSAGNLFAYAVCYDWGCGAARASPSNPGNIGVHFTPDDEVKPKPKKTR
jgi:mRNA export factor